MAGEAGSSTCLPLSSPALNDTIDFILSGFLTGCRPLRYSTDLQEYFFNMPVDATTVTVHYTGSRAEGIDRASDDDFMFVNHSLRVVDSSTSIVMKDQDTFIAINVRPGYVHLRRDHLAGNVKNEDCRFKLKQNDGFLRSDVVKAFMLDSDPEDTENDAFFGRLTEHGPALTDEAQNEDFVVAVPCYEWPEIAREFKTRTRTLNQPAPEIIDRIVAQGCLYVAVGHPLSTNRGKEWRLSFSLAEKILVRSWNDVKTKCYIAVKALCKENLDSEPKLICSYFIKTAIFWLSEKLPESSWDERPILYCISTVMAELLSYTTNGMCPNYFVPSNNMMDHFSQEQRKYATSKIESVMNDLPLALLQSKLAEATFKKSKDFVTLYLVLKNSDSPSNAETQLSIVNSHNKAKGFNFKHYDHYYESMNLTETLRDVKGFFFQRIQGNKTDSFAQMVLGDLPSVIEDQSFRCTYEKLVFLALGDMYQYLAASKCGSSTEEYQALITQAESWILKVGVLKQPSGFGDGGILASACRSLLYYTSGNKEKALELCSKECERVFSEVDYLRDLCHWSCAVVIGTVEAKKFIQVDSSIAEILSERDLHVSPISIILYITIKCCKDEGSQVEFFRHFEQLQQWFPPELSYHEKELCRSHMLLKNILMQSGVNIGPVQGNLANPKTDQYTDLSADNSQV